MNKKKNPDLVRNIHYLIRLNKVEDKLFKERLVIANNLKSTEFIRQMITLGYVQAPISRLDKIASRELLIMMMEYRTNFRRIASLIRNSDARLAAEVEETAKAIQVIIDRI